MTPAQDEVTLSARDLLALQAFELAARTGSFKAAAEALHITASAVSHRIAGLERTLGAKLFERGPRGVVLAPAGIALAATTGHAFGDLARALARQSSGSRRLRVSAVPIFASHWLLPRLGQFLADHPEIELQVEASPRMADMEAGLVDVALRYGDGQWPGVSAERIMDLETVPVAAPSLVRRLKLGAPADVARAPLIRVSPFGASWTDWATTAGLDAVALRAPQRCASRRHGRGLARGRAWARRRARFRSGDRQRDPLGRAGARRAGRALARPDLAGLPAARAQSADDPCAAALAAGRDRRGMNAIHPGRGVLRLS